MAKNTIEVRGLKELERSLIALQKEYGGKAATQAMRPAVKAAMKPLENKIKQETPVDTGELRDSTKLKIGAVTKKMKVSAHYNSTTVIAGRVGWFWSKPSLWHQALAVEYGTQKTPANHTLERVFDEEAVGMTKRFKDTLGPAIEKKAQSLAKKRSK